QYDRVRGLGKRGEFAEALLELDNLLVAYPGNATMHELKCELLVARPVNIFFAELAGALGPAARQACARVTELAPGDPSPHLALGEALAPIDAAAAHAQLAQAESKIANLPSGAAEAWKRLIGIYTQMGALTWTEDALAQAKLETDPAAAVI